MGIHVYQPLLRWFPIKSAEPFHFSPFSPQKAETLLLVPRNSPCSSNLMLLYPFQKGRAFASFRKAEIHETLGLLAPSQATRRHKPGSTRTPPSQVCSAAVRSGQAPGSNPNPRSKPQNGRSDQCRSQLVKRSLWSRHPLRPGLRDTRTLCLLVGWPQRAAGKNGIDPPPLFRPQPKCSLLQGGGEEKNRILHVETRKKH